MSMTIATLLLIEDNPLTRKLVRAALVRDDWAIVEAGGRVEALSRLDLARPDLVLCDLALPDANGFDLLAELRVHPSTANVPVLAFTGFLSHDDEARVSAAGFDGIVTKPVEPSQLRHVVRGHLPSRGGSPQAFGAGRRIVLADDDATQRKLARFRLS